MLKISLFSLLAIISLVSPAIAQNSNTAVNRPRPVRTSNSNAVNAPVRSSSVNTANAPVRSTDEISNAADYIPLAAPPANSTIRGRVYYEDSGRAVKRTSLMFIGQAGSPGETTALTDGDGNFVVKNVRAGTYYAVINAPGVVSPIAYIDFGKIGPGNVAEKENLDQAFVNFDKIIVDGVNETYVQIPAKRGGAVGGRVMYENGDSAIGVKVEILRKVNGKFVSVIPSFLSIMTMFSGGPGAQTDDRGMYRFPGLPPGEYIVKVSESAEHTDTGEQSFAPMGMAFMLFGSGSLLNFYYPDATDAKDAQVLNVLLGQELGEINIVIPDKSLFALSGKIVSQKDKKPLKGAKVSLQKKVQTDSSIFNLIGAELNTATTDAEGNWKFKEIPKGDYSLTIVPDNSREDYPEYPGDDDSAPANVPRTKSTPLPKPKFAKSFKDVQIEDKDVADLIIEVGYGAVISGTVSTEDNKAMPQNVSLHALGEHDELLSSATVWNYKDSSPANRAFALTQKINNEFKLESIAAGKINLKFNINDADYYVKSARSGMTDLLTSPLELKEGEMLSGVRVVLANDVGTLKGKILDDKDHPAPGVALLLVPTDQAKRNSNFFKNVRSDTEGKFEIKLPPGEYFILFFKSAATDGDRTAFNTWLDEAIKNADKVSISAEGTSNVTLKKPG